MGFRRGWLSLGAIGALGCVLFAISIAQVPTILGSLGAWSSIDVLRTSGYGVLLLAFAGIWIAFGVVALRSTAVAPPKGLPALFLITASALMILNAGMLFGGFRDAYPGEDRWSLLVRNLLFFSAPSLVLAMFLVGCARTLMQRRHPVAS